MLTSDGLYHNFIKGCQSDSVKQDGPLGVPLRYNYMDFSIQTIIFRPNLQAFESSPAGA